MQSQAGNAKLLDVIDEFLGYSLEEAELTELEGVDDADLLHLASDIDTALRDSWQYLPAGCVQTVKNYRLQTMAFHGDTLWSPAPITLIHASVAIPIGTFITPLRPDGREYRIDAGFTYIGLGALRGMFPWMVKHAKLLRTNAVILYSDHVYQTHSLDKYAKHKMREVARRLLYSDHTEIVGGIAEFFLDNSDDDFANEDERLLDALQTGLGHSYSSVHALRKVGAIPLLTRPKDQVVWNLARETVSGSLTSTGCELVSTLQQLKLPKLSLLPVDELVALRGDSEAFFKWRVHLEGALRRTQDRLREGKDINLVFKEELLPLQELAERIDAEVRASKSIKNKVNAMTVSVMIGGAILALISPVMKPDSLPEKLLVLFGTPLLKDLLYPVLFPKPKPNDAVISSMYHAVFG